MLASEAALVDARELDDDVVERCRLDPPAARSIRQRCMRGGVLVAPLGFVAAWGL